jgi:RND family efflux transporter MFP subunit
MSEVTAPGAQGRTRKLLATLLPGIVLAVGVAAFAGFSSLEPARPPATVLERDAPWVEVMALAPRTTTLDVIANGTVRARDSIAVGPEVGGRVAFVSTSLRSGSFVSKGEVLVKLDDREPRLVLRSALADLSQASSELARLVASEAHVEREVDLLRQRVELAKSERDRQLALKGMGAASQDLLDRKRSALLAERSALQAAERVADLLPHDLSRARAAVARAEAARDLAQLALERLVLRAPFDGQVKLRQVEVGQVVAPGSVLAGLDGHEVYEVAVQITHDDLTKLARIPRAALPTDLAVPPGFSGSTTAQVTWLATRDKPWQGRVTRIESVDSRTRTLPVIVEVERPWDRLATGRSPLLQGAYCRVQLEGRRVEGAWVVPERALREGDRLYVLRAGRLAIVPVAVEHLMAGEAVITPTTPLVAGDQLVTSAITYPVEGMALRAGEAQAK